MALPVLTQSEIDNLIKERTKLQDSIDAFVASIPIKQAQLVEATDVDLSMKKFFDYYNDLIIGAYDTEYRNLAGYQYTVDPISEQDLEWAITAENIKLDPSTTRVLTPEYPTIDVVRIPEFDGGNTNLNAPSENKFIDKIQASFAALQSGYSNNGASGLIQSNLTPTSTSIDVFIPSGPIPDNGNTYIIRSGSTFAAILATSVSYNSFTQIADINFTFVRTPDTTISSGNIFRSFNGFNNTERTNKVASDGDLQIVMNELLQDIDDSCDDILTSHTNQLTALNLNEDEFDLPEIATAISNINSFNTIIVAYQSTLLITNAAISALSPQMITRESQITARIAEILFAYTGRADNFYDERYKYANIRANTLTGTLGKVIAGTKSIPAMQLMIDSLQDAVDAIDDILS